MDHEKVTSGVGVAAAEMRIGICEPTWDMALEYGQTSMGAFSAIQSKQALGERPDKMRIGICEPTWAMVLEYGQKSFYKFSWAVRRCCARQAQKMGILDHLFTHTIWKNLGG